MNYSSYNQPLTLDELRAYQAGHLSAAEQHRVERLLLENPLYADALEGLEAIQQAGSSLHRQTRGLHEALQVRIHEAATPRRLMPLWVTSLAASVLLVLSVAFYLIYTTDRATSVKKGDTPAATHLVQPHVEPGTVLLDINDLGTAETTAVTERKTRSAVSTRRSGRKMANRQLAKLSTPTPVMIQPQKASVSGAVVSAASLPIEPQLSTSLTEEEQQAILRVRTINPERAFSDWPPAVKL